MYKFVHLIISEKKEKKRRKVTKITQTNKTFTSVNKQTDKQFTLSKLHVNLLVHRLARVLTVCLFGW